MADQQTERYQARQQHQRIVLWGCDIHRTPRGRNARAAPTRANYSPASPSEEHWPAWRVAPSTRQSDKVTVVAFRWAVDKQLRDAVVDFAGDSRLSNPWAADLYRAREHADTTTPTPSASSPGPGSTSSGAAGKTTSPTTPNSITPFNASWRGRVRLDTRRRGER
jgi:hypothetical protein